MQDTDWTYGAEHEWADHPRDSILPSGCTHNTKDHTIVNSNGIANDPTDKLYQFGGEINTPGTSLEEQIGILRALVKALPTAKVNYRSNLHIHVRVPGLKKDLAALKQVQRYIHDYMPLVFPIIEPIPVPASWEYTNGAEFDGAMRRYKRRVVSHHTLLSKKRLALQMGAKTVKEFFEAEVPHNSDGRPLWHLQPRVCVSLRQMLETDTIEFRHWPGTLDPKLFRNCLMWCTVFLETALDDARIEGPLRWARAAKFPPFPPYIHYLEVRYRATIHDGTVDPKTIRKNIELIERGKFDNHPVVKL